MGSTMLAAVLLLCLASTQACVVNTTLGAVRGTVMTSRSGRQFCSYRGIPYAQPPVGPLRFKAPVPASPWTEELNGTADGPMCPQPDYLTNGTVGQEDCLYLNVHTPQVSGPADKPLAVLFYVHGGGLVVGTGGEYGAEYLLDKDIILVTINYRLGMLGFLSTGDDVLPGNFGFKDMILALQWTAQNIAAFGGDAGRVTIQGESSGSVAVHLLMLSPRSTGLFWAAIGESNTALVPRFAPPDDPMTVARQAADALNCSTVDATSIVECLQQVDASDFTWGLPFYFWRVVVENETESNPEPFLTATPMQIVLSGDFANIPWLMGLNSQEGATDLGADIFLQSGLDRVNRDFDSLSKKLFLQLSVNESMVPEIWQRIADFYLGNNHTVTLDNVVQLMNVFSDRSMAHQTHKASTLHTRAGKFPIYKYLFDYQGKHSLQTRLYYSNSTLAHVGTDHADELLYLFKFEDLDVDWPEGHPDLEVIDTLVTLWTNFAAYHNPTPADADNPQGVQWPAVARDGDHVAYYKISQATPPVGEDVTPLTVSVQQDMFKERMDFWDSLPLKENQGQ